MLATAVPGAAAPAAIVTAIFAAIFATIFAAIFAAILGLGGVAQAATGFPPSTNVVLFTPPYSDPLVARLEAELTAVGIAVRRLAMPAESQLEAAITRAITSGASAAIRVIPRSRGAEVWTGDTTARMLRRRSIRADTSDAALSVIALRTVEFLRASLLDVKRRGPAMPGVTKNPGDQTPAREAATAEKALPVEKTTPTEKAAPSAVPATETPALRPVEVSPARPTETPVVRPAETPPTPPTEKPGEDPGEKPAEPPTNAPVKTLIRARVGAEAVHFEVAAGPAVVASWGGTSPLTSAAAMGRAWLSQRIGIEMIAMFPMVPSRLNNTEGSVEFRAALFGGGVAFRLTPAGRWNADASLGGSALLFRVSGSAVGSIGGAPNMGGIDSVWKAAAHARIGGGVQINEWLLLRADVLAGMAPSSRILLQYSFTDTMGVTTIRERATWGPSFAAGTVGLQAAW